MRSVLTRPKAVPALPEGLRTSRTTLVLLRLTGQILEFVAVAILARRLGPNGFGALAIGLLAARYGGIIGDWGASVRGVRDVARGDSGDALWALQRRRVVVSGALSATFVLGALATSPAVAPLAMVLLARGTGTDWISLGLGLHLRAAVPAVLQGLLSVAAALLAGSLLEVALLLALGSAVALAVSRLLNRLPARTPGWRNAKTDPWLLLATVADQVVASGDMLLVGVVLSASHAGIYAAIYRLPNALQTVAGLIALSGVPAAARLVSSGMGEFQAARRRLLRRAILPAVVAMACAPIAALLVVPIFGGEYSAGRIPAVLLVLAAAVNLVAIPLHPLYLALGDDRAQARLVGTAAVAGIAGDLVVLSLGGGLVGVAAVALAVQLGLLWGFLRGTGTGRNRRAFTH